MTARPDTVERALADLSAGRPVVVADDHGGAAGLVVAATMATTRLVAFMVRHTSGFLLVAMEAADLDRLRVPAMAGADRASVATGHAVAVDASSGVTTGISAADRAVTIQVLADPTATPQALRRPGHVVPVRAAAGGVLEHPGLVEAAVDLARAAGLRPAAAVGQLVNDDDGGTRHGADLTAFADQHGLVLVPIADLVHYQRKAEQLIARIATTRLSTRYGEFLVFGYRDTVDGRESLALVRGEVAGHVPVLVQVHVECLTGEAFGSSWCDCGARLDAAMRRVAQQGRGVVVYVRTGRENTSGLDGSRHSGARLGSAEWEVGARILVDLGVRTVRLSQDSATGLVEPTALTDRGIAVADYIPSEVAENLAK